MAGSLQYGSNAFYYGGFSPQPTPGTSVAPARFLRAKSAQGMPRFSAKTLRDGAQRDLSFAMKFSQWWEGRLGGFLYPDTGGALLCYALGATDTETTSAGAAASTLNGGVAAGVTSIVVTSGTGFAAGQTIVIDSGAANQETAYVTNVATNTITLATRLFYAHANGVAVADVAGIAIHSLAMTSAPGTPMTWEQALGGISTTSFLDVVRVGDAYISEYHLAARAGQEADLDVSWIGRLAVAQASPTTIAFDSDPAMSLINSTVNLTWPASAGTVNAGYVTNVDFDVKYTINNQPVGGTQVNGGPVPPLLIPGGRELSLKLEFLVPDNTLMRAMWFGGGAGTQPSVAIQTISSVSVLFTEPGAAGHDIELTFNNLQIVDPGSVVYDAAGKQFLVGVNTVPILSGGTQPVSAIIHSAVSAAY